MRPEAMLGRTVAGRFTITQFLGEGGMASVFVAERDAEPRRVALKIMDPELMSDGTFVRRFQREAKAAARVKHPSSVKIFEYGVDGALSYIVMELVDGDDLYVLLEREGAISQVRAARILAEVCEALMVAHELGIVHRDLKPENIMVIQDPSHPFGERVKVLDFGIAKILDTAGEEGADQGGDLSAVTRVGTLVGTPAYMSPEQCGLQPIDTRADIYTCGVLLYQLVTGRLPFEGETPLHTATKHIHAPVPAPSAAAPGLDARLEALILKALAKKPADRHQTARHLGASLRKLASDLPDVAVGGALSSRRQTSSAFPRDELQPLPNLPQPPAKLQPLPELPLHLPELPPPQPMQAGFLPPLPPLLDGPPLPPPSRGASRPHASKPAPMRLSSPRRLTPAGSPALDDDPPDSSLESARTVLSDEELGAPLGVLVRSPRASDSVTRLISASAVQRSALPAPPPPARGAPLSIPDSVRDLEDSTTLVRPGDGPQTEPPTPRVEGPAPRMHELQKAPVLREVKTTLRSAADFGLRTPERRAAVGLAVLDGAAPGARPGGAEPHRDATPRGMMQTVRMASSPELAPSPLRPASEVFADAPTLLAGQVDAAAPVRAVVHNAMTEPMPRSPPDVVLVPTELELSARPPPRQGWMSGRRGMIVGFLAGVVITAALVLLILLSLR